jgi:integrase
VVPKQRYLHLPKTKNGDARDVPLSTAALKLLGLLPKEGPLFLVAASTCDTLFRRARDAAGIEGMHFHDSRREATTRLAKRLDVLQLAKAGGM